LRRLDAVTVFDGGAPTDALARTTDLGVGAHPDDVELLALAPIAACAEDPDRSFTAVTCTDGAGSARGGAFAALTDAEMVALRHDEQRRAAEIGRYGALVELGHPSAAVRGPAHSTLVSELADIVDACGPTNLYTHNLADKHATHVAVAAAVIEALRTLPVERRPWKVVGIEAWRDLDWLNGDEQVRFDVSAQGTLSAAMLEVFASQIDGAKRYDVAVEGRRRANATFFDAHAVDGADAVIVAMDLTPLVRNDDIDPVAFVSAAIDRFRAEVETALRTYFP
jgi:LmbE family N-acetylglucosaminyl deacetylase